MTACTNNGGSRARRAVTAALVGVLSVGAAPMVALATGAAPASGDVQLQATPAENFDNGKVTIVRDGNQVALDPSNIEFEVGSKSNGINVAQIQLGNDQYITNGFKVTAYHSWTDNDKNGKVTTDELGVTMSELPDAKGTYVAVVSGTGDYAGGNIYLPFTMVNKSLKGAVAYDKSTDSSEITFSTKQYAFVNGNLGIKIDGKDVPFSGNFSATWYDANGKMIGNGADPANAPIWAGSYTVVLDGQGDYAGSKVSVPVVVKPLDLSKSLITLNQGCAAVLPTTGAVQPTISSIEGLVGFSASDFVVSGPTATEKGTYTYTVKLVEGSSDQLKSSVINEGTVSLDVVDAVATTFNYDGSSFTAATIGNVTTNSDGQSVANIDLSDEKHFVFDADEFEVMAGADEVDPEYVTVEVVNAKTGEKGDLSSLQTVGDWYVTVKVNASACNYAFGGSSAPVLVHVKNGDIASATMYVTYNGETKNSFKVSYTGDDFLGDIDVVVKDVNGNNVPSDQYEIAITKGGEAVDTIVDHGTYTIAVKSDSYDVATNAYATFEVTPVTLTASTLRLEGKFADQNFLPYTGEVLSPGYKWLVSGKANDDDAVWKTLSEDVYSVTYEQNSKEVDLKEPGTYTAKVVVSDPKGNFVATAFSKPGVIVANKTVFADVPSDAWYAEEVYVANEQGYIGGIGGTNLFAPMNDLTRADFACVLYRMAGGKITASQEDLTNENVATISQFSDVDPHAYYAKAVAWCVEMGVANGYGDTFGSARTITTEEFATMLARYAKLTGVDTTVDTDEVLAGVADGDQVSSYARDAVAWAVENEYLAKGGNLIDPQGTIYRARAVKVVVDFQPEQLKGDLADDPNLDSEK